MKAWSPRVPKGVNGVGTGKLRPGAPECLRELDEGTRQPGKLRPGVPECLKELNDRTQSLESKCLKELNEKTRRPRKLRFGVPECVRKLNEKTRSPGKLGPEANPEPETAYCAELSIGNGLPKPQNT